MNIDNYKNIIILGKSLKFINFVKNNFIYKKIRILKWRNLKISDNKFKSPDLILICGFDYKSYRYDYKKYYEVNISKPLHIIRKLCKKKTTIIYINTILKKKYTLSRYYYAKHKLNEELIKNFKNLVSIESPTIITRGNVDIFGSKIQKIIFKILIYLKILEHIDYNHLKKKIINHLKYLKNQSKFKVNGVFLTLPRNIFIDRILRFL